MIALCSGEISYQHFDAMVLLAQQLHARGHYVVIDERFVPDEFTRQRKFEAAPYLADLSGLSPSEIIILGAQTISETALTLLSQLPLSSNPKIWALGHFTSLQNHINARNRLAYATGQEPGIQDLAEQSGHPMYQAKFGPLLTAIREAPPQTAKKEARVLVYVPYSDADDTEEPLLSLSHLAALHFSPTTELHILTTSSGKDFVAKSSSSWCSVFSYMELSPVSLLSYFDILVFLGSDVPGQRMAALAISAMGEGKVVIDCTASQHIVGSGAPVLRGPTNIEALASYLQDAVLNNREEIGRRTTRSKWLSKYDVAAFERNLRLVPDMRPQPERAPRKLFFPTNGNGLGHAQRCALIAEEMSGDATPLFAGFPSCVTFLRNRGFSCVPMVSRTAEHTEEYAADVLNYLRLGQVLRRGDHFVFDGGFVFDSVYRIISELGLSATWIRRGLWQKRQVHRVALERERAFTNVVVPAEVFEELNTDYSTGEYIHNVGPIVREVQASQKDLRRIRDDLSIKFDRTIETLVVSMLGGGVASRRTAQTQLLCNLFEKRQNCLHLIVAWPNAIVDSALYGWANSFVVRTSRAVDLCRAADLCVSAAGYNSFHELIYAQVPAIYIPQSAPYLDDQERRAQSAAERHLSVLVKEDELFKLEREALAFIDGGKGEDLRTTLRNESLPEPGNSAAAQIIERGFLT